jgi:formylglycine-generating enzyme required for sulfatase activity
VNISDFYMGVFEVTQKQWDTVGTTAAQGSYFSGDLRPRERVKWTECDAFAGDLASLTSSAFDLPTEAQWEYACKAGTSTNYSYGDAVNGAYMWYQPNSGGAHHEVGTTTTKPNPWGLYDMHGNVYEWCLDWYGAYSAGEQTDPTGPGTGTEKILRGGSWNATDSYCRSSLRLSGDPATAATYQIGLRVVMAP